MSAHLLLVTLGPVQEFIAQARRTRDLWYGSHLLSELGRAAARELVRGGSDLVFPALQKGDPELQPCLAPLRPDGKPPFNVPNKLVAEVPAGIDPKDLAGKIRDAVMRFWRDSLATPVKNSCAGLLASGIDAVWAEQIETSVEFTAAWAPLGEFAEARRQVEAAVAARKNLRDFSAWVNQRGDVPKSSLDGSRETVLAEPDQRNRSLARRYRIADGEQLDAVGLVKRAGGEPGQFVPIINVAFAAWIAFASRDASEQLDALKRTCGIVGVPRVARDDLPCARAFPFDASVLLPTRWGAMFKEQGLDGDPDEWGRRYVQPLLNLLVEPYPYVACLVADGDRMGRAIDRLASAEAHRAFSRGLAAFAGDARRIVEQEHLGVLVYSGGDDVLAFLPLPEALRCAEELRDRFSEVIGSVCQDLSPAERPTLSVGLGVGHVLESMGDLLALGREAEALAKRQRNSLGVIVEKRSGGKRAWAESWGADPGGRLRKDAEILESRLSSRRIYEIAAALRRLPSPQTRSQDAAWARLLALEVRRSLSRVGEGALEPEEVGLRLDEGTGYGNLHRGVSAWIDRVLIARTFARATPRPRDRATEVPA
jgi:CRISPR-associated protein Cmr2